MTRPVPEIADRFVQGAEGEILRVYDDARPKHVLMAGEKVLGTLTAGTGHTGGLRIGMPVTPELSEYWRYADLETAAHRIASKVKPAAIDALSQHQYAALLSFVFNLGTPGSTIWILLNAGALDQVPMQIMRFDQARDDKGVLHVVDGLIHRRMAEVALWKTPDAAMGPVAQPRAAPTADPGIAGAQMAALSPTPPAPAPTAPAPAPLMERDTVAPALAIIAAAPAPAPPSSVTRGVPTPPVPMAMKPLRESKSFMTTALTFVLSAGGAVAPFVQKLHDWADGAEKTLHPYAAKVPYLTQVEAGLLLVVTATAGAAVVFQLIQRWRMQFG